MVCGLFVVMLLSLLPAFPSTPIAVVLNLPLLSIIEVPLSAALPMLNPELLLPVVENSKFIDESDEKFNYE